MLSFIRIVKYTIYNYIFTLVYVVLLSIICCIYQI